MSADNVQGPCPAQGEAEYLERFRAQAAALWGADRAAAIEVTLARAAHALWLLGRLDFAPGDAPAFYLDGDPGARGAV